MTSENKYADYFTFNEVAKMINNNNTLQIRFYTISQNSIQFKLSDTNGSDNFNSDVQNNQQRNRDYGTQNYYRSWETTTPTIYWATAPATTTSTPAPTTTSAPTPRYPFNFHENDNGHYYEFGKRKIWNYLTIMKK